MKLVQEIAEWRSLYSKLEQGTVIGFVPTMGYLHQGHLSLVEMAKRESDIVVMSIFVNPLQFGENEDFSKYPRDMERDCRLAEEAGVDYLFIPTVEDMYPGRISTTVHIQGITEQLCGRSRPGHFDGVATVVSKLFHIIQPTRAYFGQKDAQQVAVIQQMVQDLNMPVEVVPCPIVREADGLAMSSRNVYLSEDEREQATVLYQALQWATEEIGNGERSVQRIKQGIGQKIRLKPLATIDYVEVRSFPSLEELQELQNSVLLAVAVRFGHTRLIDNAIVHLQAKRGE